MALPLLPRCSFYVNSASCSGAFIKSTTGDSTLPKMLNDRKLPTRSLSGTPGRCLPFARKTSRPPESSGDACARGSRTAPRFPEFIATTGLPKTKSSRLGVCRSPCPINV
jgi:hypothetical protein